MTTTQAELYDLITRARERGALIRVWREKPGRNDSKIRRVRVISGISGCSNDWMSEISAAERLREFLDD